MLHNVALRVGMGKGSRELRSRQHQSSSHSVFHTTLSRRKYCKQLSRKNLRVLYLALGLGTEGAFFGFDDGSGCFSLIFLS